MQPPNEIDGARVIEWAWSGDGPFGEVPGGLPIGNRSPRLGEHQRYPAYP